MNMKKIVFLIGIFTIAAFSFSCGKDSKWVAKIKGETITLGDLNEYYYSQEKAMYNKSSNEEIDKLAANFEEVQRNPTLDKREFLENLIRQKLVYNKAVDEGMLKNKDLEAMIQMQKEGLVVGWFVREKFKNQIEVTDQEIAKVYADQRAKFKGVPVDQAEQYIRQQLTQQKMQLKLREYVDTLREEGGIKRNLDLITKKNEPSAGAEKKDETKNAVKEPAKEQAKEPVKEEPKK